MAASDGGLAARWRRLNGAVAEVKQAAQDPDSNRCPDAVARALDALYDMWEYWQTEVGLTFNQQDGFVAGDADGETAAGLVFARGGKTHDFVEFGELSDSYSDTYYDHYGSWRWQAYSDPQASYRNRNYWYARHVEAHEVLPPLQASIRWLIQQPQLQA